ncbi:nuclear transport factor 2 family protein [Rhodospirillaceae bacterium KN72]|uniref:Nuclear transport factor 2 family protein n=1 Tax=Pacificispira spongiicola TaxID=2729598 RepID=A0A7Y0E2M6_9PROT|nr:nuclear transport factor 2 family protein [Pacificispira spongiicola]NMM46112.1 nuclear transport factor 2 family protein [Pacificispira spongiicola]
MIADQYHAVSTLMDSYFDGLHHADSTVLRGVFHPRLAYVCATEGDELYLDLDTYMARVDKREPPAKRGEARDEAVLEIAFGNDRLAHVTARMSMMGRTYLDFLTLVRDGAEWRIVAKVFTYLSRKD